MTEVKKQHHGEVGDINIVIVKSGNNTHTVYATISDGDYGIYKIKPQGSTKTVIVHGDKIQDCMGILALYKGSDITVSHKSCKFETSNSKLDSVFAIQIVDKDGNEIEHDHQKFTILNHNPRHKVKDPWKV